VGVKRVVTVEDLKHDSPLYARSCLKIIDKNGALMPFHYNPSQIAMERARQRCLDRRRPPRIVSLKARQTGISTWTQGNMFRGIHLNPNRRALTIAHIARSAQIIFRMSQTFLKNMPKHLAPDVESSTKLGFELKNGSQTQVDVATEGGGRGWTAQYLHLSEFSRYPDPAEMMKGATEAVPSILDSLIVIESTARGMNEFYDVYIAAKTGQSDFVSVFQPWHAEPGYRISPEEGGLGEKDKLEQELVRRFKLDDAQLAWRRWKIRTMKGDLLGFQQEYPADDHEAFIVSGSKIFEPESVEHYLQMIPPNVEFDTLPQPREIEWDAELKKPVMREVNGGRFHVYKEPKPRHLYVVGVDCSEGDAGSDFTPVVVLDRMTLEVVAVWDGRQRPDMQARTAFAICHYYNQARCIWEANSHGLAFQIEFVQNLLYDDFYQRETGPDSVSKKITDKAGFYTSPKTRSYLFNILRRYVDGRMGHIWHPRLVMEFTWLFYEDGFRGERRVEKPSGKTMDLSIALALCLEEHRGSPDNDLAPLPESDRELILTEIRRHRTAVSMGHESHVQLPPQHELTGEELEMIDEQEYRKQQRARARGTGA
jgi:hypothetical protein